MQLAQFYYSDAASAELNRFFTCVREMIELRELAAKTKDKDATSNKDSQLHECRRAASQVEQVMKNELCLIKTHLSLCTRLAAWVRCISAGFQVIVRKYFRMLLIVFLSLQECSSK